MDALLYRGFEIPRRADGYFNATAMCQAGGKEWKHWRENKSTAELLEALAHSVGIPTESLVQSETGRTGGTWIHPQVAIGLAQWISAPFQAWCIGVVMERIEPSAAPEPVRLPALDHLDQLMGFFDRWGFRLDDRDRLQIKQHAQQLVLPPAGGTQGIYNDIPLSRAVFELFNVTLPLAKLSQIGRALAARFRSTFNEDPKKHDQYVDGALRQVAHYDRDWVIPQLQQMQQENPILFCR